MPTKRTRAAQTPAKPPRRPNSHRTAKTPQATPESPTAENSQFHLSTANEVARAFEVNRSTVYDWINAGMPGRKGHYNYCHIMRWLLLKGPWKSQRYIDSVLEEQITRGSDD